MTVYYICVELVQHFRSSVDLVTVCCFEFLSTLFTCSLICCFGFIIMPSVLLRCWLGGRKDIRPVKTEWWDAGEVIYLGEGADLHMAELMPLPLTVSCCSKSRLVLPFWCQLTRVVPDKIKEGRKMLCVCVCFIIINGGKCCAAVSGHFSAFQWLGGTGNHCKW